MSASANRYVSYEMLWRNGRLGNQMWQIASTAGIARAQGTAPRFPTWEYQPFFRLPDEFFVDELPVARHDLGTDYLQELRHFEDIADDVRHWFAPATGVIAELARRHPWFWRDPVGHFTALHVRRGDYVSLPDHFPAPSVDYYRRAVDLVGRDTTIVVFSDDIEWCENQFGDDRFDARPVRFIHGVTRPVELVDRVDPPEDYLDLMLMTFCDRHIISNSSFSWWGAYLSDDPAPIYPSRWYGPALADIPWKRMFDDRWVEVDAC